MIFTKHKQYYPDRSGHARLLRIYILKESLTIHKGKYLSAAMFSFDWGRYFE